MCICEWVHHSMNYFSLCVYILYYVHAQCPLGMSRYMYMFKSVYMSRWCVSACVHVGSVHVCVHLCCVQNTMHHAFGQLCPLNLESPFKHIHLPQSPSPPSPLAVDWLMYHDVAASLPECGCDTVNPWLLPRRLVAYQTLSTQVQLLKSGCIKFSTNFGNMTKRVSPISHVTGRVNMGTYIERTANQLNILITVLVHIHIHVGIVVTWDAWSTAPQLHVHVNVVYVTLCLCMIPFYYQAALWSSTLIPCPNIKTLVARQSLIVIQCSCAL